MTLPVDRIDDRQKTTQKIIALDVLLILDVDIEKTQQRLELLFDVKAVFFKKLPQRLEIGLRFDDKRRHKSELGQQFQGLTTRQYGKIDFLHSD